MLTNACSALLAEDLHLLQLNRWRRFGSRHLGGRQRHFGSRWWHFDRRAQRLGRRWWRDLGRRESRRFFVDEPVSGELVKADLILDRRREWFTLGQLFKRLPLVVAEFVLHR